MCLCVISEKRVAENAILVYKCLDYNEDKTYCTPFQYLPITFDVDGVTILFADKKKFKPIKEDNGKVINVGIHAFTCKENAEHISSQFPETETHYAVIPKGATYYLGSGNEIASDELIIFKRRKDYSNFKKRMAIFNNVKEYKIVKIK